MKITLEPQKTTWVPFIDSTAKLEIEWTAKIAYSTYTVKQNTAHPVYMRYRFSRVDGAQFIPSSQLIIKEEGIPLAITQTVVSPVKDRFRSEQLTDPFIEINDKVAGIDRSRVITKELSKRLIERSYSETIQRTIKIENKTGKKARLQLIIVEAPAEELRYMASTPKPTGSEPPEYTYDIALDIDAIETIKLELKLKCSEKLELPYEGSDVDDRRPRPGRKPDPWPGPDREPMYQQATVAPTPIDITKMQVPKDASPQWLFGEYLPAIIQHMNETLPDQMRSEEVSIQFNISGGGGDWYVMVKGGRITLNPGRLSSPQVTLGLAFQDLVDLLRSEADPPALFMEGRVTVAGDLTALPFLQGFIGPETGDHDHSPAPSSRPGEEEPNSALGWTERGRELSDDGDTEGALDAFNHAIRLAPDHMDGWWKKVEVLEELGRDQEALKCYDIIIHMRPENIEARLGKADLLVDLEKHEAALLCYDEILSIDNRNVEVWREKAETLFELDRFEDALKCYNAAIRIHPNEPDLWYEKADILEELERDEEAEACHKKAEELEDLMDEDG